MHVTDAPELNVFIDLATDLGVTSPQSNDILSWWKASLRELKVSDVQFLSTVFTYATKQFDMSGRFVEMSEMLEQRKMEMGLN